MSKNLLMNNIASNESNDKITAKKIVNAINNSGISGIESEVVSETTFKNKNEITPSKDFLNIVKTTDGMMHLSPNKNYTLEINALESSSFKGIAVIATGDNAAIMFADLDFNIYQGEKTTININGKSTNVCYVINTLINNPSTIALYATTGSTGDLFVYLTNGGAKAIEIKDAE